MIAICFNFGMNIVKMKVFSASFVCLQDVEHGDHLGYLWVSGTVPYNSAAAGHQQPSWYMYQLKPCQTALLWTHLWNHFDVLRHCVRLYGTRLCYNQVLRFVSLVSNA